MPAALARFHDGLTRACYMVAMAALLTILLSYLYEIVARSLFNSPTSWANDVVGYMLSVSAFLALPQLTRDRGHVAVTVLVDALRPSGRRALSLTVCLIGAVFCGLAAWITGMENRRQMLGDIMTLAVDPIPKWWITVPMTIGLVLSALHFVRQVSSPEGLWGNSGGVA